MEVDEGLLIGTVQVEKLKREFRVCVVGHAGCRELFCEQELLDQLNEETKKLLEGRLNHTKRSGEEIVADVKEVLEKGVEKSHKGRDHMTSDGWRFYSHVLQEIEGIGWDLVEDVNSELCDLKIRCLDSRGRKHLLNVHLPAGYPNQVPLCSATLPNKDFTGGQVRSLKDLVNLFKKELETFQEVWDMLDDLDENTWVLDPSAPDRSQLYRRIALGNHCSLHLKISELAPMSICECQFIGPENRIAPLRTKYNAGMRSWDKTEFIRANLGRLLDIEFPQKPTSTSDDPSSAVAECGICYCFRLPTAESENEPHGKKRARADTVLPDCICENAKCGRSFHPSCVQEWFQSLPTSRFTFDRIYGECPYCGTTNLSVRQTRK